MKALKRGDRVKVVFIGRLDGVDFEMATVTKSETGGWHIVRFDSSKGCLCVHESNMRAA